ncbi:MAG: hypothetical protein RR982_04670 [Kiritimatiellia bacterium]
MKYMHTGMIVGEKLPDMIFMEPLKVWVTDASKDKYSIEFLYFEVDSPMAAAIQEQPHVAYDVENIDEAMAGKSILWNKMDIGNAYIAFIYDNDIVVELYQSK